jgi:hypothetical protein
MSTKSIVSVSRKLTADLEEAARLKAEISRLETDLKAVAGRIVGASKLGDQYQTSLGKITISARTNRDADVDVLSEQYPDLASMVIKREVSWSQWDAAAKLGFVPAEAQALVTESKGASFLSISLSTVR